MASLRKKVHPWKGGVLVTEVIGLRVRVKSRLDGRGYDITKSACELYGVTAVTEA